MAIERTLRMAFETDMEKQVILSVKYCKDDLTEIEVKTAMDAFITNQPFTFVLASKVGAEIVERDVSQLF